MTKKKKKMDMTPKNGVSKEDKKNENKIELIETNKKEKVEIIREKLRQQITNQPEYGRENSRDSRPTIVLKGFKTSENREGFTEKIKKWCSQICNVDSIPIERVKPVPSSSGGIVVFLELPDHANYEKLLSLIPNHKFNDSYITAEPCMPREPSENFQSRKPKNFIFSDTGSSQNRPMTSNESRDISMFLTNVPNSVNENDFLSRFFSQDCKIKQMNRFPGMIAVTVEWKGSKISAITPTSGPWSPFQSDQSSSYSSRQPYQSKYTQQNPRNYNPKPHRPQNYRSEFNSRLDDDDDDN